MDSTTRPHRPPRRARFALEPLEDRALLTVPISFTFNDPNGEFNAYPGLLSTLQAAGQILGNELNGQGSIEVQVNANDTIPRASGGTAVVVPVSTQGNIQVYENGTIHELRTGVDPNGAAPDVTLDINARDYLPTVWFDPTGVARTAAVPGDRIDFMSVAIHELSHSLGFQGYRTIDGNGIGTLPSNYETSFDALTSFGAGGNPSVLYFTGTNAERVYGGPVPLTSVGAGQSLSTQNFYHVANPSGLPGSDLLDDLMNGVVFHYGQRYAPGPLDLAIFADLGLSPASAQVQFSASAFTTSPVAGTAVAVVTRTGNVYLPATVQYATTNGTALAGTDYTPTSGTLSFAPGETRKTIAVPITRHALATRSNLAFNVMLGVPSAFGAVDGPSTAPVTILGRATAYDFDGDGKADVGVFRASNAVWQIANSTGATTNVPFGQSGTDIPVAADFDGDGKADYAIYRPSTAQWFIVQSRDGARIVQFGQPGVDIPVPADFDGDGKADLAVFRPTTATWLILQSTAGGKVVQMGQAGVDRPVAADYDGDGKADLAVFRPTTSTWLILQTTAGGKVVQFGAPALDQPIPADYDGDGKADLAVFRPTTAQWLVLQSTAGGRVVQVGTPGVSVPVPADYDGDGKADFAAYRPDTALWLFANSAGVYMSTLGLAGQDLPLETPLAFRDGNRLRRLS